MPEIAHTGLYLIEEDEATGEVAAVYDTIRRELQMPFVPNLLKGFGDSPSALNLWATMNRTYFAEITLPGPLVGMISYTIATKSNCTYCSVSHELTCRSLGVDEQTLDDLVKDLERVNPQRVAAIIEFALKVAKHPQELVRADYDRLRDLGVTDDEILQIILVAGIAVLSDIVADALKIEVDEPVRMALGR